MKRYIWLLLLLSIFATPAHARERLQGWCQLGAQPLTLNAQITTTFWQQGFVSPTVTIYDSGTTNLSTIYSDNSGTPKANPFTAAATGYYTAYANDARYDVRCSGGGIAAPFTFGDFLLFDPTAATGMWSLTNTGVFTNTQQNEYLTSLLNSIVLGTEYTTVQGGNFATESLAAGAAVPNTSTVHQANGVGGYANNSSTTTQAVGVYGQSRCIANSTSCLGGNFVASSLAGKTGVSLAAAEFDFNVLNTTDTGSGISIAGSWSAQSTNANALNINAPSNGFHWSSGIVLATAATIGGSSSPGVSLQPISSAVNKSSQSIDFVANDAVSGTHEGTMQELAGGLFQITNSGLLPDFIADSTVGTSTAGFLRLTHGAALCWRNNAGSGNQCLGENTSNQLTIPTGIVINGATAITGTTGSGGNAVLGTAPSISAPAITGNMTYANTTPVANLTGQVLLYNASGTQQTSAHTVVGNGNLTSASPSTLTVTLSGSAVFAGSSNYTCWAMNGTTATNTLKLTLTSGSAFTITGPNTVNDLVYWGCVGN